MKAMGIKNRCRLFEIPKEVEYITAMPQMKRYMEFSAKIYSIYLRYISKDDIYPYSIDEMFLDITTYLKLYKTTPEKMAKALMDKIYTELGLPSACGIGTNLFLAKVALDITAKHSKDNIGYLDEEKFKSELWNHTPLSDFWQIARGIEKRLNNLGLYTLKDVSMADEDILYKEFGINAEILIDHANGIEPVTIKDIKGYKNKSHSVSQSQILFEDYEVDKARLALTEMVEVMSLQLVEKKLVTNSISLGVGYSKDNHKPTGGMVKMTICTNVYSKILPYFLELFDKTTSKVDKIRRLSVSFNE
jgi:DNA polymerase V